MKIKLNVGLRFRDIDEISYVSTDDIIAGLNEVNLQLDDRDFDILLRGIINAIRKAELDLRRKTPIS